MINLLRSSKLSSNYASQSPKPPTDVSALTSADSNLTWDLSQLFIWLEYAADGLMFAKESSKCLPLTTGGKVCLTATDLTAM